MNQQTTWIWNLSKHLTLALENYKGTLFFVSHDRVFVDSLATRILEIKDGQIHDFRGTYAEFLKARGIDG